MKKLKTGIGCLIFSFLFFMAYHSQAQTLYVYDEADLLSEAQEQNLQGWAEEKKERGCEITVSMKKEDFSFKMNERSSFCVKINLR